MSNIGYVRVSTVQQNNERQLAGIELDRIFEDTGSGKDTDRAGLKAMMDFVREGDTVHVHELSRLGRNVKDLLEIIDALKNKGCTVKFMKEGIVAGASGSIVGNLMLTVLAGVAQMEREMLLERQAEGYQAAKAAGRIPGRGASRSIDRAGIKAALDAGKSIRAIAEEFEVSTQTVQRIKKEA